MSHARDLVTSGVEAGKPALRGENPLAQPDRLDLSESISFFRRRMKLIALVTGLTVLAGLVLSLVVSKTYRAEATVMLTNDAAIVTQSTTAGVTPTGLTGELLDTQVEIIKSREMAAHVADSLSLTKGMNAEQQRDLIDRLQHDVSAQRSGESYALTIAFEANEAPAAANIANEFTRQYVGWEVESEKMRNSEAREIVAQKLAKLRDQAQADTQALQQYRIAHNLLSTSGATLTEQEISTYNQEVTKARAEAAEDAARLRTALAQLQSGSSGDDVGEALNSPVISSLRAQEALAAATVADLSARYGAQHPQLIRANSQLADVRSSIQAEIERVISNLRAKQAVSAQRLGSLSSSLANARSKLSQNNGAMVGLSELERAAEASQGIYDTYLNRFKELIAADGSEQPNARVLTLAEVPTLPSSPNIPLNLVLSLIIGLGLGLVAAYIAEALFHGMTTPDEIERDTGMPFLASIPLLSSVDSTHSHAVSAIQHDSKSVFTESFRALSAAVDQTTADNSQIIAITSALPGEGKTVISCCLSHVMASRGERTILIDCDMRRQGISRLLDMRSHQWGLVELLDGSAPLNLDQYAKDNMFCVLPIRPNDEEPEHLLTGQPFIALLQELRGHFDRIILDLPPVLPIAASRVIASRADAVVMAARWRKTSSFAVRAALKRMPAEHVNLAGVVLSAVDMRQRAFLDANDPYFYYSQYSEYYS